MHACLMHVIEMFYTHDSNVEIQFVFLYLISCINFDFNDNRIIRSRVNNRY